MSVQSSLARYIPSKASPQEIEEIKRDGWREHGILVVAVTDHRLNWLQEQVIRQIGQRLYGDLSNKRMR